MLLLGVDVDAEPIAAAAAEAGRDREVLRQGTIANRLAGHQNAGEKAAGPRRDPGLL
jgi:hypothetical protein